METRTRKPVTLPVIACPRAAQPPDIVKDFIARPSVEPEADRVARDVLADIRLRGDEAVLDYVARFDRAPIASASALRVPPSELDAARRAVDSLFKKAARDAASRIRSFARAGRRRNWRVKTPGGGFLGEQYVPLDRVGAYIPGGAAPLASTALMTVALAQVAGVPEIVACTPANPEGRINPYLLYALDLAGASEIYKIGGIQAIGAMAYGTATLPRVQKIVGPGGPYVTAAKRAVYGEVALDMVAGPSEIAILADARANPRFVAADLLSQAEHGSGSEKFLLVTDSRELANRVRRELIAQAASLTRRDMIERVFQRGALLVVVKNLDEGIALCNAFAPEHFELLVERPARLLSKVRAAGAIFLGPWSPESAGDFAAGPSHVLPTGGTARIFSGLTVDDFMRRSSIISFTREDLRQTTPVIEAFGRVEGLDAHASAATIRFS